MVRIHHLIHDDPQIAQHIIKLYRINCARECYLFAFIAPLEQFVQIRLNFHAVLKTLDGKKQLQIIGVKQHTDAFENHRYSVDKPNETQWSEMIPLWDIRCHPDILRNSTADSNLLNSFC
jgi:hypothetical protein